LVDDPERVGDDPADQSGTAPHADQRGAPGQVTVQVTAGVIGVEDVDDCHPGDTRDHQEEPVAAALPAGHDGRDAQSEQTDDGERTAQEDDGREHPGSPGATVPEVTSGQEEEQRGYGLDVQVEADRLVDARIGQRDQDDAGGDDGCDPDRGCLTLEHVDDPEVGDQPRSGDAGVLNQEEGEGTGNDQVKQAEGPEDQLEVPLDERVSVDGVERVQVAGPDEGPGLVVDAEVLGQEEAAVKGRREDHQGHEAEGEGSPAGHPDGSPVSSPPTRPAHGFDPASGP